MNVGRSTYYAWRKRPAKVITSAELHLYRRLKALFKKSRNSLGSRELSRKLREEGFSHWPLSYPTLMHRLNLKVRQRSLVGRYHLSCAHSSKESLVTLTKLEHVWNAFWSLLHKW